MNFISKKRVKQALFLFTLFISKNTLFSQEEISLPHVITYIPSSLENKIIFTAEDIFHQNLSDLPQLIQNAGIQLLSYGPYGLEQKPSIRGFTDETVRVVIDGVCVNNPQTGAFDFSTINLDSIEKLEIIKGGYTESTDDEDAVGGVIYITTKKQSLNTEFTSNSQFTTYFVKESILDTFSQSLGYIRPLSDKTYLNLNAKAAYAQNNFRENNANVKDAQLNLQLTNYFNNGNSFNLNNISYVGRKNTPGPKYSQNQGLQNDLNNTLILSLFSPNLNPYFTLKNNFYWLTNNRFYTDILEDSEHYINSFKYNLTADFLTFKNIKETAGFTFDYTNLNSTNDGLHNQFTGVLKETTKIALSDIFSINVPLAIKFSGNNFAFTPKIAFSSRLNFITITLDVYRMIQFPTMDDLFWEGVGYKGNPDLLPEDGFGFDLSFLLSEQIFPINLTFFSNYYRNKIQWSNSSKTGWMPQNISSAFYFGVDLSIDYSILNNLLNFKFNGEYLYTSLLNKDNEYTYGKRIMWTPDLTASLITTLNLDILRFSISINYTGKRYLSNMNLSYLKPYYLINLSGELLIFSNITPFVTINNLLNTTYQAVENYPMPGISLTLGLKTKF